MKTTIKKSLTLALAFTLALALTLTLAACGMLGDLIPGGGDPGSTPSITQGGTDTQNTPQPQDPPPSTPEGTPDISQSGEVEFSIAQGFDEREVIFRLNLPQLQERVNHQGVIDLSVKLSDSFEIEFDGAPPSTFHIYVYSDAGRYDDIGICTYEGDVITAGIYLPENAIDWDSINDITVNTSGPGQDGLPEYHTFSKRDAEVPLSELLPPGTEDMRKLRIEDLLENAVFSAKDNGDGTITFTYRDATLMPPLIYMAPWEPLDTNGHQSFPRGNSAQFEVTVKAAVGREAFAAASGFTYPPQSYSYPTDPWDNRFFSLTDVFSEDNFRDIYRGDGIPAAKELTLDLAVIDENGLTMIWTEDIAHPYSIADISEFSISFFYDDSGYKTIFYPPDSVWE